MPEQTHPRSQGASPPRPASATQVFTEGWGLVLTGRILPATFFVLAEVARVRDFISFLDTAEARRSVSELRFYSAFGYKLLLIISIALIITFMIVRHTPVKKSQGVMPRALALVGTFMMSLVAVLPQKDTPVLQTAGAALLLLSGLAITILALSTLGRSFSIMPEARKLVVRGPYSYIRHPMYLGEMLTSAGIVLETVSLFSAAVFAGFVWVQIQRMKYEEAVLQQVFPDYLEYKARIARLVPKVY